MKQLTQEEQFQNDAQVAFDAVCDLFGLSMSSDWTSREQYFVAAYYLASSMRDQLLTNQRVSEASYQLFRDLVYMI